VNDNVKIVFLVQVLSILSIILDIPILRQVLGFIYLTFVPGFVTLKALGIKIDQVDEILVSVGLSLTISMLLGVAMSAMFPFFGLTRPLSFFPVLVVFSVLVFCISLVGAAKGGESRVFHFNLGLNKTAAFQALFFSLPFLSIIGALSGNVTILLIMIIMIAVLFGIGFRSNLIPQKSHLIIILLVSLALVFQTLLLSIYIMGQDIHYEVYAFEQTKTNGIWTSPGVGVDSIVARFESVLSITVLPTVYSLMLNIRAEAIYKIIYPFLFCLVPLVLYRIYELQTRKSIALVSVFTYISATAFFGLEALTLARQMIAELLLVLLVFLLVNKALSFRSRLFLLTILCAGLVVSHYALAYLFLAFAFLSFIVLRNSKSRGILSIAVLLLLFSLTFVWYVYVSDAPLLKLSNDFMRIRNNFLGDFTSVSARSEQVATLASAPPTIVSLVHRAIVLVQNALIVIGVIMLFLGRKELQFDRKLAEVSSRFGTTFKSFSKFDVSFCVMSVISIIILLACIVIPNFASATFNFTRFYAMAIIFLAPFFVLAGETIFNRVGSLMRAFLSRTFHGRIFASYRKLALQLVAIIVVASFLFSVGFVEHVTGVYPESWALDMNQKLHSKDLSIRLSYYSQILKEQDVVAAVWFSGYMNKSYNIYAGTANGVLVSYGLIISPYQYDFYAYSADTSKSYAFVPYFMMTERIVSTPIGPENLTALASAFSASNRIYTNGICEIYSTIG
jgi:uncharacterized membrane protein